MTIYFVPVTKCKNSKNNTPTRAMAKNAKLKVDIVHENSLDNSADSEYMGMVEEGSYGSPEDGTQTQLVSQSFLENDEENTTTYSIYSRQPTAMTYKLVHMTGEDTTNNMASNSPIVSNGGEYYVIGDPVEMFRNTTTQKKPIRRDPLEGKTVTTKKRDDKRRATHNEVERRRRDKINTWITKLAALVPNSGLPDSSSKGGILAKACDHITELTEKQKKLEKLEVDNDRLVMEIMRLNQELAELRKDNTSMRSQLADTHILPDYRLKTEP